MAASKNESGLMEQVHLGMRIYPYCEVDFLQQSLFAVGFAHSGRVKVDTALPRSHFTSGDYKYRYERSCVIQGSEMMDLIN